VRLHPSTTVSYTTALESHEWSAAPTPLTCAVSRAAILYFRSERCTGRRVWSFPFAPFAHSHYSAEHEAERAASSVFQVFVANPLRAGLKGRGPGAIFTGGPYDVFHDVIVCIIYVFADSQRSRSFFQ